MARVRVEPSGIELDVPAGVTIMQAARDAGYHWPNQCDMQCRCSNCFFRVVEGASRLSAMGRAERATLLEQRGRRALDQPVRLGCQTSVTGDVVIHKVGVSVDPFA
jgi:ferredoxin